MIMVKTKINTKGSRETLSFNPKEVVKALLGSLPIRAQDVVKQRFGLGKSTNRATLEAIGQTYGITRERVRQIENFALKALRKSPAYQTAETIFDELEEATLSYGGIVNEQKFQSD